MKRTKITPTMAAQIITDIANGMSYVATAKKHNISPTTITNIRKRMDESYEPRRLQPCGTNAAYHRHLNHGERPCLECSQAHTDTQLEYTRGYGVDRSVVRAVQPCGTNAAYMRHRRNGEEPCYECVSAHTRYNYYGR